jgi:uncharacterized RDD family membrane protein YckC
VVDFAVAFALLFPLQVTGLSFWVTRYDERVDPRPWGSWFLIFATTCVIAGILEVVFTVASGQTPGKDLLGIRVDALDGSSVGLGRATGRWVVTGFVFVLPPIVAIGLLVADAFPSFLGADRRSWADRLAGTRVVSVRGVARGDASGTFVVRMGMEKWIAAVTGDLRVLPSRRATSRRDHEDSGATKDEPEPVKQVEGEPPAP